MFDADGLIESNIAPVRLSEFRAQYGGGIVEKFETDVQKAGATLIDFSEHHCWEDLCHKFTPAGYPVFVDTNHYIKPYAKYWASAVDFLVEF